MSELEVETYWTQKAESILKKRTIVGVQYVSKEECENLGWYSRPLAIFLDNGTYIIIQSDDEGNDGGAIYFEGAKSEVIPTL